MELITLIIKIITFPGAFLHAFLEHLACRMYGIPIEYSKYFQRNELCGHVEHMLAPQKGSFGVCFLPHILSLLCGIVFSIPASINIVYLGKFNLFAILFCYVGISCLMNCFPLLEDSHNMMDQLFGEDSKVKKSTKILLALPTSIMYIGSYLEHYFVTVITSLAFFYAIPYIIALFIK